MSIAKSNKLHFRTGHINKNEGCYIRMKKEFDQKGTVILFMSEKIIETDEENRIEREKRQIYNHNFS